VIKKNIGGFYELESWLDYDFNGYDCFASIAAFGATK